MIQQEATIRLLVSLLLGGLIGLERQYHHKPAGFRTMIMISIGSCLFSLLSTMPGGPDGSSRIAANVVTGIGFLGAGVIFRAVNRVNGITTAASIWAVAAVGMAVGMGYYIVAVIAALLILSVLAVLPYVEERMNGKHLYREYRISYLGQKGEYFWRPLLDNNHLKSKLVSTSISPGEQSVLLEVWGRPEDHTRFIQAVIRDDAIKKIDYAV